MSDVTEQADLIGKLISLCRDCEHQCATAHSCVSEEEIRRAIASIAVAWKKLRSALETTLLYGHADDELEQNGTFRGWIDRKLTGAVNLVHNDECATAERLLKKHERTIDDIQAMFETGGLEPDQRAMIKLQLVQISQAETDLRSVMRR